jgi:hypothetical protein
MTSKIITRHLEAIKAQGDCDAEFLAILNESNANDEDGKVTATKLIELVGKRYAESKESHS